MLMRRSTRLLISELMWTHQPMDPSMAEAASTISIWSRAGQVLAAQLLGQGEAVEPLVRDLVRGPGGDVADLLRLVGRLQQRFLYPEQPLKGGRRFLQLLAALDDLGSHHGCRLPSLVARF